jgi:hypothetical protein
VAHCGHVQMGYICLSNTHVPSWRREGPAGFVPYSTQVSSSWSIYCYISHLLILLFKMSPKDSPNVLSSIPRKMMFVS